MKTTTRAPAQSSELLRHAEQAERNATRLKAWHRRNAKHLEQEHAIRALLKTASAASCGTCYLPEDAAA